ncbi:MAG: rhomboid family intramembrane serine protease [Chitinivibrionales bacterium]|nr:rhomboid family intramembrane serine protease [Chitinivibrionales bacterium]
MMMHGGRSIGKALKWLLIANIGIYVLQILPTMGNYVTYWGALIPFKVFTQGQVWRLVTYMFLHGQDAIWHLLFNMLALWMFGTELEQMWGTRRFAVFYFLAGILSGLFSVLMWKSFIIGASGAVLAVLTAYAYYFPHRQVLFFFIFPMPVRLAVAIIGFISIAGSLSSAGGIAHLTHLAGIAIGLVYVKYYDQIVALKDHIVDVKKEKQQRKNAEEYLRKRRYFEDVIDPILKKIHEQGMESLTGEEKRILKHASKQNKERIKKSKIIPFDIFK